MRKLRLSYLLILILILGFGCAANQLTKEKVGLAFMDQYIYQYKDYQIQSARTDLTEGQKEVLRTKKSILIQVWPMLKLYNAYILNEQVPPADMDVQIGELISKLIALGGSL